MSSCISPSVQIVSNASSKTSNTNSVWLCLLKVSKLSNIMEVFHEVIWFVIRVNSIIDFVTFGAFLFGSFLIIALISETPVESIRKSVST